MELCHQSLSLFLLLLFLADIVLCSVDTVFHFPKFVIGLNSVQKVTPRTRWLFLMVVSVFVGVISPGNLAYVLKLVLLTRSDSHEVLIVFLLGRSSVANLSLFRNVYFSTQAHVRDSLFHTKLLAVKLYVLK